MKLIPTHPAVIVYGLLVLGMLALAIAGISNDAVLDEMQRRIALAAQIPPLMSNSPNAAALAAEQRRAAQLTRELKRARAAIRHINQRRPLLPEAFPSAARPGTRVRFAELYQAAVDRFQVQLRAGGLATAAEIEAARGDLAELAGQQAETCEGPDDPPLRVMTPPSTSPAVDAARYAQVTKARRIRCYADRDSFDVSPIYASDEVPSEAQMWFAQVGLWIQQDIVAAMAQLNEEAAKRFPMAAYVEQMPVKRIVALRVYGYWVRDRLVPLAAPPAGRLSVHRGTAPPPSHAAEDEGFDVVLFRVVAIVDQRDLLRLIDPVSKRNFYRCAGVTYAAIADKESAAGYVYGTEPAVWVALDFEAYFSREIYRPLMPDEVRELLDAG